MPRYQLQLAPMAGGPDVEETIEAGCDEEAADLAGLRLLLTPDYLRVTLRPIGPTLAIYDRASAVTARAA